MDKVFDDFTEKIVTKEELLFFWKEVNNVQQAVFKKTRVPLSEKVRGKISEDLRGYLQKLEKEEVISNSPSQQISFLEELKKYLRDLSQAKIEIAFTPNRDFISKVSDWFKKEVNQKVILDITVNPLVVGGILIEYGGKYGNFSLAKEIDELILRKELYD